MPLAMGRIAFAFRPGFCAVSCAGLLMLCACHAPGVSGVAAVGPPAPVAKVRAVSDPSWQRALDAPVSGLLEGRVLPSGVDAARDEYVSYATYYWPNPKTPDGLPWVVIDGRKNQVQIEAGDAPRLAAMNRNVRTLCQAYARTGDERYALRAAEWVRLWMVDPGTRMRPHLEFSQIRIGRGTRGNGGGIIDMAPFAQTLEALAHLRKSGAMDEREWAVVHAWLRDYYTWLTKSRHGLFELNSTNNHFLYYSAQCVALAEFLGDGDAARRHLAVAFARMDAHIMPDGSQPLEIRRAKGFEYSVYALRAWVSLAEIGDRLGVDYWNFKSPKGATLRKAYDYLAQHVGPSGKPWPQSGAPMPADALKSLKVLEMH